MTTEGLRRSESEAQSRRGRLGKRLPVSRWKLAWLAGALVFCALSAWAFTHTLFPGEQSLAHWEQNHPRHPPLLGPEVLVDFIGGPATLGLLTGVGALVFIRLRRWDFLALVLSAPLLASVGLLLKVIIRRPRPVPDQVVRLPELIDGFSFPSGHALQATIICVVTIIIAREFLGGRRRRLAQAGAIWLPAAVGFARVFDGVHWPTDVFGGVLLGLLLTTAAWHFIGETPLRHRLARQALPAVVPSPQ